MLKFFRNNAAVVGWTIVGTFVFTMIAGALLMGTGSSPTSQNQSPKENWAYIGDIPVNQNRFKELLTQSFAPYTQNGGLELDPQMVEIVQYSALMQAVQYTVLYEGGMSAKVKPSKEDMSAALQRVYIQYDMKDNRALKKALKENNYPYDTFVDALKADVISQKFLTHLQSNIHLTNQDVDNTYVQIRLQHALFKPSDNAKEDLEAKSNAAATALQNGSSFEDIIRTISQDPAIIASGGDIGWVGIGMLPRDLEKAAFSLGKGEWSQPIRSHYGYHIVKLTDRREIDRPASINYEEAKEKLLPKYQQSAVETYIQAFLERYPLEVKDPILAAYYYKARGNLSAAINAYQAQISQSPYDPRPHYLLAQLYGNSDVQKGLDELKKAKIKVEIAPALDFASLHLLEGDLLRKSGQGTDAGTAYDKAIEVGQNQARTLTYMEAFFKERQDKVRESRVAKLKEAVDAKAALIEAAAQAQQSTGNVGVPR